MIAINDLSKTYRGRTEYVQVLDSISLNIRPGEIVSIMGQSGSGKSTLMSILGCLEAQTSGTYQLDGKFIDATSEANLARVRNENIGFVFQSPNLLPNMTVLDNVLLPLRYGKRKKDSTAKALSILEILKLRHKSSYYPRYLLPIERQQIAVARALVNQPSVLLADEPTGNLDSVSGKTILGTLQQLNEEMGITILIATHDQDVAVCTRRVVNIRDGALVSDKIVIQTRLERSH
jgi:putative ABC transport system ATP-binding protein